jgi:hypothetical protein
MASVSHVERSTDGGGIAGVHASSHELSIETGIDRENHTVSHTSAPS